ncbi:phosphatase PAP2 family protein [Lactococcus petauri]|uniref:Phosphatase PAP2 family protein n=1 Tax=Lactococcus petauri TaxID=1940789 RepID=A0ABZ2SFG6_9LACT|nr:phosphatase PAP2 family protein [Lactococcus petauri]OAL08648.1 hypothetical protein A7X72_00959 [Lactococcus garvieae]MCI3871676.1 phosphatase PAP2 family protein [Lactococcus petauri]MCQ8275800.1 hypothetical protein [Lactococcus petauri]MCR6589608.1 phosphatase PAP2 family protein [Lactococcus petauri]MCU7363977.1 phosphatase PAP2 family protein [Lactococcus petauri]
MNNKRWYICGITSLLLFALLALIIKGKALESPLPFVDPKIQAYAGHLQNNDSLLKLSTLIDHSLVPIFLVTLFAGFIFLIFTRNKVAPLWLGFVLMLCSTGASFFKLIIGRVRPETYRVPPFLKEQGMSFPSGHVTFIAALLGCLFLILLPKINSAFFKIFLALSALVLVLLTILSRLLVGVHYPSDTVGSLLWVTAVISLTYPLFLKFNQPWQWREFFTKIRNP